MRWWRWILLAILAAVGIEERTARTEERAQWTISRFAEPPITTDGLHTMEGTCAAPPWAWHARIHSRYQYGIGRADRASQFILNKSFGLGFPKNLEASLSFPVGWTIGSKEPPGSDPGPRALQGMGEEGPAIGDLKLALLFSAVDGKDGGLGLLVGLKGGIPTGHHERLMGRGIHPRAADLRGVSGFRQQIGAQSALSMAARARVRGQRAPVRAG